MRGNGFSGGVAGWRRAGRLTLLRASKGEREALCSILRKIGIYRRGAEVEECEAVGRYRPGRVGWTDVVLCRGEDARVQEMG